MNVYDFDKTIYSGDSSIDFYLFVMKKQPSLLMLLPRQGIMYIKYLFKIISKEKLKESFFFFLKKINNIDKIINDFWSKKDYKIKEWYLAQKKSSDVIISASPEFLLQPICNKLLINKLIASKINPKTGCFSGNNCYGDEKVRRFNKEFKNKKINNFYTDSFSDKPLIDMAEKAYIVDKNKVTIYTDYKKNIIKKIKEMFVNRDFIVFIFCGGLGTVTNFIVSLFASNYINSTLAYVVGYSTSIFITYYLNIKLIFEKKINTNDYIKFVLSYIPNFIVLLSFVSIFLNIFHWNKILVYGLAGLLGIPITFVLVKIFALKKGN